MRQEKVFLGNVKGPTGDPGAITSASADVGTRVGEPTVSVELSGPPNDQAIAFHFDGISGLPASIVSADADTDGTCMEAPELSVDVDELGSGRHNLHFHLNGIRGVPGYFSSVTTEVEDVEIDKPEVTAEIGGDPGDQSLDFLFRGMRGPSGLDAEIVSADADTDGTCEDEPNITVDVDNLGFGRHNLHFHMDGMRGKPGYFTSANAVVEDVELEAPTCDVTVGGEPGAQTLDFLFKGLRGPAGRDAEIQAVTATVDNTHSEDPTCTVVLTGEPGDYRMEFQFNGIMGLPGPVATPETVGVVKPDDRTIHVDGSGTISVGPGNVGQIILGDGSVVDFATFFNDNADALKLALGLDDWTPSAPDPRSLGAKIAEATVLHDEAWSGEQDDPLIGSWHGTDEQIRALQDAIDAARSVYDDYLVNVFSQPELDAAQETLQRAMDLFKSQTEEVLKDLGAFNALRARIEAVNDGTHISPDGKEVPFGERWVTQAQHDAANKALSDAEAQVTATRLQSVVDVNCASLEDATELYEGQVVTAEPDTSALDAAIDAAKAEKKDVAVSARDDGLDLEMGSRYVTDQATLDAINDAIAKAEGVRTSAGNQNELDAATAELLEATETFAALVRMTFDWYAIPEDVDWSTVPWSWVPETYDWTRFPWDRVDYGKVQVQRMPWTNQSAMDALVQSEGGMDLVVAAENALDEVFGSDVANSTIVGSQLAMDSVAKDSDVMLRFVHDDATHDKVLGSVPAWAAIFKNTAARDALLSDREGSAEYADEVSDEVVAGTVLTVAGLDAASHGSIAEVLADAAQVGTIVETNAVAAISSSRKAMKAMVSAPDACTAVESSRNAIDTINHCGETNVTFRFVTKTDLRMFLSDASEERSLNQNLWITTAGTDHTDGEYTIDLGRLVATGGDALEGKFKTLGIAKDIHDGVVVDKFFEYAYFYKHPGTNSVSLHGWIKYLPIE